MNLGNITEKIITIFLAFLAFLFSGWDELLTILVAMQVIDIISGVMKGWYDKNLSSKTMKQGFYQKFAWWLLVITAHFIDMIIFEYPLLQSVVALIGISNEGLSVVENLGQMGIIVPETVIDHLKQVQSKAEKQVEKSDKDKI